MEGIGAKRPSHLQDQEQDVEVIRRRLHIRDPPHRITLKDIANLADVLGLVCLLSVPELTVSNFIYAIRFRLSLF